MSDEQCLAQSDIPPVAPEEALLRRVPRTYYPDPEQPRKPRWEAFRPNDQDSDGLSVGRRNLVRSIEAFSYAPGRSEQRNVAQILAVNVHEIGMNVQERALPDDPSHALIPELNCVDYKASPEKKRAIKSRAMRLAREYAQMVFELA